MIMEDISKQVVTFEYNEQQGIFHANIGRNVENTHGYQTVCKTAYGEWDKFKEAFMKDLAKGIKPSFSEVVRRWNMWRSLT